MERNRWETAIRCLEVALHPGTSDDEVIAGVNGFRRTAGGTPLGTIFRALAGEPGAAPAKAELERLKHTNLVLRRQAADAERRLCDAERRLRALDGACAAAEQRADAAERELAEFQAAYGRVLGRADQDNAELRQALGQARQANAERRSSEAVAPFRSYLAAAQRGTEHIAPIARRPPAETHRPNAASPRQPWMA